MEEKIVHSVISTAITLHYVEQLSKTPFYNKDLKNKGNLFLNTLLKQEKYFDSFLDAEERSATDVHDVFYDYIDTVKSVSIPEMGELSAIIQAYKKDPKSILGIAKKVL